ncbi:MAG: amylo-alpha-1,6-glucosidase, partial [Chloroflexota bacterium]
MLTGAVALKEDDLQFISGEAGDIPAENPGDMGMYYRDTRFLNRYELTINDHPPVFLSNTATKHYIATFQYINPNLTLADGRKVRQQTISIRRSRFVTARGMHERIGVLNCNRFEVTLDLVLTFDADFRDMFSIRGFKTQHVAGEISVRFGAENLVFQYRGRDAVTRTTGVAFDRPAEAISSKQVRFTFTLPPQQFDTVVIRIQPDIGRRSRAVAPDFDGQLERLAASYKRWDATSTSIESNNEMFDREVLRASRYDIRGLLESTPHGLFPHAGVPWYAVPFGRDAIITSLQTLIYNPSIAEGTLRFLAAYQGNEVNPFREEEPGKIMHELRRGELASLGEVPHTPYFGTVDATPLFLILFVETMRWLNSDGLYADVLPAVMRALSWIDDYGDLDGDGYVEYIAHRPGGVVNQGWKDSADAVQNSDGSNAIPPVALIEVQGYVYQAKVGLAALFRGRGDAELADRLEREAKELKRNFNRDFWMEGESYFAQALDRDKAQIQSVTSNPGHCLWAGICDDDKARALADRLLQDDMLSGWGIRTLSTK